MLRVSAKNMLVFDSFLDLPGGQTKFALKWDEETGAFISFTNINTVMGGTESPNASIDCELWLDACADQRNVLSLVASRNLRDWTVVFDRLLYDDTGMFLNPLPQVVGPKAGRFLTKVLQATC